MKVLSPRRLFVVLICSLVLFSGAASAANYTASAGISYEADSGLTVTAGEEHTVSDDPFVDSETVLVNNVRFSATGSSEVTAENFVGDWTNLSNIDASSANVSVDPDDKKSVTISGSVTRLEFRDPELNDHQPDFVYSSGGSGTINISGLPASTTFTAAKASGASLGSFTSSGSGVAEISVDSDTNASVYLFEAATPTVDNTTASPQDGSKQSLRNVTLSAPITDADFGSPQGDSVDVTIYLDGEEVATRTILSNQTVEEDVRVDTGGEHTWNVTVSDSYGKQSESDSDQSTAESDPFNFRVPADLKIYEEPNGTNLVDNAEVTIRFYKGGETGEIEVTRSTSDGRINMTGLPVDQEFVAVANADGYTSRRIFIESLYNQQQIYLLSDSTQSAETIFELRDYTGDFPREEAVLQVQRPINGSWQTVAGDYFGATSQFPVTLESNARYRLVLVNPETSERRVLGSYTPIAAQTERIEVTPQDGIGPTEDLPTASISPDARRLPALNSTTIGVDTDDGTSSVEQYRIVATSNGSELLNETFNGGEFSGNVDAGSLVGEKIDVTVTATLSDGSTATAGSAEFSVSETNANDMSLLSTMADLAGLSAPGTENAFTTFISIMVTILGMAGVTTRLPVGGETAGLIGVFILAAFSVIGWVGYDLVFVAGVGVVSLSALRRGL